MTTLIIYDSTGKIIMTSTGGESYTGVTAMTAEVPSGYMVDSIDDNGEPVIVPIPKSEQEQKMDEMQAQLDAQAEAILALMEEE